MISFPFNDVNICQTNANGYLIARKDPHPNRRLFNIFLQFHFIFFSSWLYGKDLRVSTETCPAILHLVECSEEGRAQRIILCSSCCCRCRYCNASEAKAADQREDSTHPPTRSLVQPFCWPLLSARSAEAKERDQIRPPHLIIMQNRKEKKRRRCVHAIVRRVRRRWASKRSDAVNRFRQRPTEVAVAARGDNEKKKKKKDLIISVGLMQLQPWIQIQISFPFFFWFNVT